MCVHVSAYVLLPCHHSNNIQSYPPSPNQQQTQMVLGFSRVERDMEDLKLDYPLAPEILPDLKAIAAEHKWVPAA